MKENDANYTRNGLFALLAIAAFLTGYQFIAGTGIFDHSQRFYIYSEDVTGLRKQTPVLIKGFEIGEIRKIKLVGSRLLVELRVQRDAQIPKPSAFYFGTSGFFTTSIEIEPEAGANRFYRDRDTIQTLLRSRSYREVGDSSLGKNIPPVLKEVSRDLGKALLELGKTDSVRQE